MLLFGRLCAVGLCWEEVFQRWVVSVSAEIVQISQCLNWERGLGVREGVKGGNPLCVASALQLLRLPLGRPL